MRDFLCARVGRVDAAELDQHADRAAVVLRVRVRVDQAVARLEANHPAERHVLAQLRGELRERLAHRGALEGKRGDVGVALGRDELRDRRHRAREVGALGDEVGVAVQLDDHADVAVDDRLDRALGGLAVGELPRLAEALLAEPVHRALEIAFALLERLLAVHHPRAGCLAQGRDVFRRNLSHRSAAPLSNPPLRSRLGALRCGSPSRGGRSRRALGLRTRRLGVAGRGRFCPRGGETSLTLALRGGGGVPGRLLLLVATRRALRA